MTASYSLPVVTLEPSLCVGCTTCVHNCPTEAIRVRKGKAHILAERCVDCGNCVRTCPHGAKKVISDPLSALGDYRYNIALAAPSLYAQFDERFSPSQIAAGLRELGFHRVEEVAASADIVSAATGRLFDLPGPRPLISSACPAVLRLVQIRFPSLIPNLAPLLPPMEVAALTARLDAPGDPAEVGVFFIGPCAGKVRMSRESLGYETSALSGAISIAEIYVPLLGFLRKEGAAPEPRDEDSEGGHAPAGKGRSWCRPEGEIDCLPGRKAIAATGMEETIALFEELEQGRLDGIEYIEALGCPSGCLGGPLAVENPVIARARIRQAELRGTRSLAASKTVPDEALRWTLEIEPRPVFVLDRDIGVAMKMMKRSEEIRSALPGLDCGSCGAPTCQALADDIVLGRASDTDCIFRLRDTVRALAQRLLSLAELQPPGLDKE
jgi:Na+-translocating ferredoxin:NAD+ oxidoreductase RNF subunit RnfB